MSRWKIVDTQGRHVREKFRLASSEGEAVQRLREAASYLGETASDVESYEDRLVLGDLYAVRIDHL